MQRVVAKPIGKLAEQTAIAMAVSFALAGPQTSMAGTADDSAFTLGEIVVVAPRMATGEVGSDQVSSFISQQDMRKTNRDTVGDALNALSGVTMSTNSRNEKTISVRGFDSRQVPLFIDGIPVYVPYDGYVDFNRFTTADLSGIQVAKGFSSLAYGANTLGGAINLISRKPTRVFEADVSAGEGSGDFRHGSVNFGTNQGMWYVQGGAAYVESDGMRMSKDFVPTSTEDGGIRNNDYRRDIKLSFKVGLTPNASDEYALSHYNQEGIKGQPPSTVPSAARYWRWPYWNKESLYFVSKTALGQHELLKVRIYNDRYDNEVDSYTNASYTTLKTSGSGSVGTGRSIYNDRTNGATAELETDRIQGQTLRLIAQYKTDQHKELDAVSTLNAKFNDSLATVGLEDQIELSTQTQLNLGVSRHQMKPDEVFSLGNPYSLPEAKSVNDAQIGLFHALDDASRTYLTAARKSRLPTLKDRYSQRLGTYVENPNLQPEKADNLEWGYQTRTAGIQLHGALFFSDITNKIQSVANVSGTKSQMQNVGHAQSRGVELDARGTWNRWVEGRASYTYVALKNISNPATKLTDVPRQKLLLEGTFHLAEQADAVVFTESNSARWASNTVQLGGFTTLNVKGVWKGPKGTSIEGGVFNLSDHNYALADGFPSAGRTWFVDARYQF